MKDELIKALKGLTIGQATETFRSDYGSFDDEDTEKIAARKKLDAYCEGVNDVLKILEGLDVVERSKIDKAMEEIENIYEDFDGYDPHALGAYACKVGEILKRNIA